MSARPTSGAAQSRNLTGPAAAAKRCIEQAFAAEIGNAQEIALAEAILESCDRLVNSGAETCRLVALTTICATAADPAIRPDIIQAAAGGMDFRSLYKQSVYPVLLKESLKYHAPWKPSQDPFVSNPFRETTLERVRIGLNRFSSPNAL